MYHGLCCLALALGAAADMPAENYAKIKLQVELRGVLQHKDKTTQLTAREKVVHESPGRDFGLIERKEGFQNIAWTLDLNRLEDSNKLLEKFVGKEVAVDGTAELRMVIEDVPIRVGGRAPAPRWEILRTVTVTSLRAAVAKD